MLVQHGHQLTKERYRGACVAFDFHRIHDPDRKTGIEREDVLEFLANFCDDRIVDVSAQGRLREAIENAVMRSMSLTDNGFQRLLRNLFLEHLFFSFGNELERLEWKRVLQQHGKL